MTETTESSRRIRQGYMWLIISIILMAAMLYAYYLFPRSSIGPEQPISFSHRVHAGVKQINCLFCHSFADRSSNAGIPVMEKCFFCHNYIIPMHPQLVKEREHYDTGVPVAWKRIYYVPDYVKFHHQPHVRWAKIDCTVCHGQVQTMDRLQRVRFQMGFCITCHRQMGAQTDCWLACHH